MIEKDEEEAEGATWAMDLAKRRLRIGAGLEMEMKPLGKHKAKIQPRRTPMAMAIPTLDLQRDCPFCLRPIIATTLRKRERERERELECNATFMHG